ncbi:MAG: hypothetical protein KJ063_03325 [Anaerolineae bacterium]|nr:hypothetical protein [Anaerolineae bacterium]
MLTTRWQQLRTELRFTRSSKYLLSAFVLTLFVLGYVWWPLAEEYLQQVDWRGRWWVQIDWLLIGIFLFMSTLLMAGADLRRDMTIIFVGLVGGLTIESWGTQTEIWTYYTNERPPLWIIPAWPIASLTIDRLVFILDRLLPKGRWHNAEESWGMGGSSGEISLTANRLISHSLHFPLYRWLYWLIFPAFLGLMLWFVWPTLDKSFTVIALALVTLFILTPTNHRLAVLTFAAGAGLGYFLELWGTTRLCWTYYTLETPPLFAVLAHGMAAVAFWRSALLLKMVVHRLTGYSLMVTGSVGEQ